MTDTTQRITINSPVRFCDPLPEAVDVAIVGGGVIGVFTALYLAEAGKRVLLCEKGRIAGEQSSRNWGWIRQQGRDEAELPIAMQSVDLWRQIDARAKGRCGFRNVGISYLTTSEAEMAAYEDWVALARSYGLTSEMLGRAQIAEGFSGQSKDHWIGGLRTPSDGRAEPWQAVPSVAALAQEAGVVIREDCAVRRLDTRAGTIAGIHTEHGRVACEQVVIAAGAWSRLFLGAHGARIPQLSVRATVARTAPLPDFAKGAFVDEKLAMRRRDDGGFSLAQADRHGFYMGPDGLSSFGPWVPKMFAQWRHMDVRPVAPAGFPDGWRTSRVWAADEVTPFERMRVLEPAPDPKGARRMANRFAARFPGLGRPLIVDTWAGMIDAMPDIVPIVDAVPGLSGVTLATGMSGHGFGIGPGFGRAIARRLTGRSDEHDLSRFRFGRFTEGTPLMRGPSL